MSAHQRPHRPKLVMARAVDVKGRSLWDDARRRLFRNRAAVVSIVVLAIIALLAVFGAAPVAYAYDYIDYDVVSCAPDWWPDPAVLCNAGGTHWFGTDSVGRDLFVRVLYGARVSLAVGLVATLVSLCHRRRSTARPPAISAGGSTS